MSKLVTSKKLVELVRGLEVRWPLEHLSWVVWTRVIADHLQYDAFGVSAQYFAHGGAGKTTSNYGSGEYRCY
jgi:hypothetical protein